MVKFKKYMKTLSESVGEFGSAQPFFPPSSAGNFGFETALIKTSNFSRTERINA